MRHFIIATSALALMAGAANAQDLPQADNDWFTAGQQTLQEKLAIQPNTNQATNIIILVADGNGVGTNYATRLFMGQQEGGYGDDFVMHHETFPALALVKTYNTNSQTPDSAGTSTSMMTGVKTKIGVLGVDEDIVRGDCTTLPGNEVANAGEIFTELGKEVGIVSTARITHATPGAVYAHSADRNWGASVPEGCGDIQKDIASQLLDAMEAGRVDVAMGGGRRNFITEDMTDNEGDSGRRIDGRNLIEEAQDMGFAYAWNAETAAELPTDGSTPILGLFEDSHMRYEADRAEEPSLAEKTEIAIRNLQAKAGDNGFFLQVEAGRVDHAQHATNLARTVRDGAAFVEAVRVADELTDDENTLIIVTADHEHSFGLNGYCGRGSDILGLCMEIDPAGEEHLPEPVLADDGKPYTVAGFLNGPGSVLIRQPDGNYYGGRPEVTEERATDLEYLQQALIPKSSESHSAEDVAVYAKGPWAHLFEGTVEQNFIFHVMHHAFTADAGRQTAEDVLPLGEETHEGLDETRGADE
jgi:alkaline phosphatase